jgi:hypothetical protein
MRYTASIKKFTEMQSDKVTWKDEDLPRPILPRAAHL